MVQTQIDSLTAPSEDGGLLIWPDAPQLPAVFEQNQKLRRSFDFRLLGCNAQELIVPSLEERIIATGHQPGFLHPGVWIKNVAASTLASRLGGVATFLVVDNDALQQSALRWPEKDNGTLRLRSVYPFQFPLDWPYEFLPDTTSNEWDQFFGNLPEPIRDNSQSLMPAFLGAFLHDSSDRSYVARWINGIQSMEKTLHVPHPNYTPVSHQFDVTKNRAAANFLGHILVYAKEFAAAYNTALNNYRERRGIRGHQHPIPDLNTSGRIEVPFWGLHSERSRQRVSVQQLTDRIELFAGEDQIAELSVGQLKRSPAAHLNQALGAWRIRPRALTLTMFSRLLGCDLFIHGIGGAKYDLICDDCIRTFFGIEPPAYACVSATLRLDLPKFNATPEDVIRCKNELRGKLYNPQRFLNKIEFAVQSLVKERESAIAVADQLRSLDQYNRPARKSAAEHIRSINAALAARIPQDNGCDAETLQLRIAHNRIADYREWFMGFYPIEKIDRIANKVSKT